MATGSCRRGEASGCPPVPRTPYGLPALRLREPCLSILARADLPAACQIVQVTPLLRELIVASLTLAESYAPGSRDERIYELILDEIRVMAVLPFGLPEPQSEALRRLCQKVRSARRLVEQRRGGEESSMSERTLNRHFQQQTTLTE